MRTVPWHKVPPSCRHSTCPQPRAASVHRGHQPSCAAHCQSPQSAPPRPRLNNRPLPQWPKKGPSVPVAEGERDEKGGTDRRVCSSWSPRRSCNQLLITLNLLQLLSSEISKCLHGGMALDGGSPHQAPQYPVLWDLPWPALPAPVRALGCPASVGKTGSLDTSFSPLEA